MRKFSRSDQGESLRVCLRVRQNTVSALTLSACRRALTVAALCDLRVGAVREPPHSIASRQAYLSVYRLPFRHCERSEAISARSITPSKGRAPYPLIRCPSVDGRPSSLTLSLSKGIA